jgi:hypothetical protein
MRALDHESNLEVYDGRRMVFLFKTQVTRPRRRLTVDGRLRAILVLWHVALVHRSRTSVCCPSSAQ